MSMISWFHRFHGVKGLVVSWGSWCQRFHGFIGLLVSSSLPADVLWAAARKGANEKNTAMGVLLYSNRPMKRNPRQSCILDSTPWIPDPCTGARLFVRGTWIPYSIFSWIPDSEAQDSWIP